MFPGKTFGFINGIITILSLLTGMFATKVNKVGMVGTLLAMAIADPFCDSYSIYIAQQQVDKNNAYTIAFESFISQFMLQAIFLVIIIFSPTKKIGLILSYIFGYIAIIYYNLTSKISNKEFIINLIGMTLIIVITYILDKIVYKIF